MSDKVMSIEIPKPNSYAVVLICCIDNSSVILFQTDHTKMRRVADDIETDFTPSDFWMSDSKWMQTGGRSDTISLKSKDIRGSLDINLPKAIDGKTTILNDNPKPAEALRKLASRTETITLYFSNPNMGSTLPGGISSRGSYNYRHCEKGNPLCPAVPAHGVDCITGMNAAPGRYVGVFGVPTDPVNGIDAEEAEAIVSTISHQPVASLPNESRCESTLSPSMLTEDSSSDASADASMSGYAQEKKWACLTGKDSSVGLGSIGSFLPAATKKAMDDELAQIKFIMKNGHKEIFHLTSTPLLTRRNDSQTTHHISIDDLENFQENTQLLMSQCEATVTAEGKEAENNNIQNISGNIKSGKVDRAKEIQRDITPREQWASHEMRKSDDTDEISTKPVPRDDTDKISTKPVLREVKCKGDDGFQGIKQLMHLAEPRYAVKKLKALGNTCSYFPKREMTIDGAKSNNQGTKRLHHPTEPHSSQKKRKTNTTTNDSAPKREVKDIDDSQRTRGIKRPAEEDQPIKKMRTEAGELKPISSFGHIKDTAGPEGTLGITRLMHLAEPTLPRKNKKSILNSMSLKRPRDQMKSTGSKNLENCTSTPSEKSTLKCTDGDKDYMKGIRNVIRLAEPSTRRHSLFSKRTSKLSSKFLKQVKSKSRPQPVSEKCMASLHSVAAKGVKRDAGHTPMRHKRSKVMHLRD